MQNTVSLKENRVFRQLYSKGSSFFTPVFILYFRKNKCGKNRMGITVSKKLGCAVMRNRAKRLIREAYRLNETNMKVGYDMVFVARTATVLSDCAEVSRYMISTFQKTDLSVTGLD